MADDRILHSYPGDISMKAYGSELRLEILRLVNMQIASKVIPAKDMVKRAKELVAYVETDPEEAMEDERIGDE